MLKIRWQRVGRRNDPAFRLVVTDSRNGPQSGRFLEILGSHNPRRGTPAFKVERIKYWLGVGAKVSDTVHNALVSGKIITGVKRHVAGNKKRTDNAAEKTIPADISATPT